MLDCLTYYYKPGTSPFQTLSALPEAEAIKIITELYIDNDPRDTRFKDPALHLHDRKETERWLREEFILKGGRPVEGYPIYLVLGFCEEFEEYRIQEQMVYIKLPLSRFHETEISFTYFDSMFSYRLRRDKPVEYYQAEYHGKVFTLSEILSIIKRRGEPGKDWWGNIPEYYFPFIEAQVWNHKHLWNIYHEVNTCK
jgi:hypothetical protein